MSEINGILTSPDTVRIIDSVPDHAQQADPKPTSTPGSPNIASHIDIFTKLAELKLRKLSQETPVPAAQTELAPAPASAPASTSLDQAMTGFKEALKEIGLAAYNFKVSTDITDKLNSIVEAFNDAAGLGSPQERTNSYAAAITQAKHMLHEVWDKGKSPNASDGEKRMQEMAKRAYHFYQTIIANPDIAKAMQETGNVKTQGQKPNDDQIAQNVINGAKKLVQFLQSNPTDPKRKEWQQKWDQTYLPALKWRQRFYQGSGKQNPKAQGFLTQISELINSPGTYFMK